MPRDRRAQERGSSTIQMVVLLPALFALMFLGVQAALIYQARTVTLAAAQEGAREAASETGNVHTGVEAARDFVADTTAGLKGTKVAGSRSATKAQVTVTARTLSILPGWTPTVRQSASMPVERVTGQ